ncbi:MAG: phage holin family protein [Pedobacter sp.]|uniref:phage holin family protein n=1 Tax=Pedobacter frigiditerrae TaxID=2530452 RepID=UPI0012029062|nr:phage holin family protein [Pedobacter frigiditerrae]RZK58999.1 MAG: phage holin family protein [Pedobacter sp.]
MEEKKEKDLEDIFLDAKEYIDTRIEYTKLSAVEKGSKIFADLITSGAVVISFVLAFLFASFTLALYLSDVLGSYARGFGCVAGIYLLLSVIVYLTKDKYIEKVLVNLFIRKYFDKVADKDDDDEEKL